MQTGWRVGSLFEIPLYLDPLWFGIVAIATINFGVAYTQWGSVLAWSAGLVMALLLFGSVLLHELGHSLVARAQGIKVNSITLFFFGGIAAIEEESKTPGGAFQVAIAGPAVSIGLSILLILLSLALPVNSLVSQMTGDLARINLVLALFNLIPGLPLDGGQVFKAAIWKATGDRFKAVRWAARGGLVLGWMAIAAGLAIDFFTGQLITGLWIALLGWFGIRNAGAYERVTVVQETLLKIVAADAASKDFRVIDANQSLRSFADSYLLQTTAPETYFAASDGRYRGMVGIDDLRTIERSEWEYKTVNDILHPLTDIPTVNESTPIVEVINQLETKQLARVTVLSPAGAVAGVIDRGDIVKTVGEKLNKPFAEADIKRVKEEGSYPPGLQLAAIAKSVANDL
jgi:Zn-dependent protease/CBS domain-containing protein